MGYYTKGGMDLTDECPECYGHEHQGLKHCSFCHGSGMMDERSIEASKALRSVLRNHISENDPIYYNALLRDLRRAGWEYIRDKD